MATSRSLQEFGKRIVLLARGAEDQIALTVRKAALAADQAAVLATPVDTGRARANWIASTRVPAENADVPPDKSGQVALQQAAAVVAGYELDMGPIYLANNVEYIVPLENGHSRQRPEGMTIHAVQAATEVFRKAEILRSK